MVIPIPSKQNGLNISVQLTEDGILVDATGVQICGVLDDLFAYDGPLGMLYTTEGVKLVLWAPTAQVDFT